MTYETLRFSLGFVALVFATVGLLLAVSVARRLTAMDGATLSAQLFLNAEVVRRFLVLLAVAIVLFVSMPFSQLGDLLTHEEVFEVAHDLAHLAFVILVVLALWGARRVTHGALAARKK